MGSLTKHAATSWSTLPAVTFQTLHREGLYVVLWMCGLNKHNFITNSRNITIVFCSRCTLIPLQQKHNNLGCSRNNHHYAQICTTALFYMLAPTCFGSSLPSSGNFWIRLSDMKVQIDLVVYHITLVKWSVCRNVVIQYVVLPSWVYMHSTGKLTFSSQWRNTTAEAWIWLLLPRLRKHWPVPPLTGL
jgi:hypothetical protein